MFVGAAGDIVERIRLFRIPLADSVARLCGLKLSTFGAALAHAGMAVTIAGIAGMSLAVDGINLVHPGETVHSGRL